MAKGTNIQESHREEQLKQSTKDIEGSGRGCHLSQTSIITASSCAPGRDKTPATSRKLVSQNRSHTFKWQIRKLKSKYSRACSICQEYVIGIAKITITSSNSSCNCITQSFDTLSKRITKMIFQVHQVEKENFRLVLTWAWMHLAMTVCTSSSTRNLI